MRTITIDPVTRIEGHAKISILLDEDGKVSETVFHATQLRGFEQFCVGRPFTEMPGITARICGICPVSHLLASVKACDAIMSVRIPPAAAKLRELLHCAQIVQSHALSFFHLSAPDFLLGFDSDPARRNILGVVETHPDLARDGIALRKFGQQAIAGLAGERIHPSWTVPGGVASPLAPDVRERILAGLPQARAIALRAVDLFKSLIDRFPAEVEAFGNMPTMYAGLVGPDGNLALYDGNIRFVDAAGGQVADVAPADYHQAIGEAALPTSYLKAPYWRALGPSDGIYRVGPLARLNVATHCGTPTADAALADYRARLGRIVQSSFFFHYARLIEILYGLDRMESLLADPALLGPHVRATAGVNAPEGIGIIEAPRGTLIHHYKVDENGLVTWANLIVATGNNNLAISRSVDQVARAFVDGTHLQEGMLDRIQAVVRAYDPCLSCSTHADGSLPLDIQLLDPSGQVLDRLRR